MQRVTKKVLTAQLIGLYCVDVGLKQGGDLTSKPRSEVFAGWDGLQFSEEKDVHTERLRTSDVREGKLMGKGSPILNLRQFSAVSSEELAEIAGQLGVSEVLAEWLGANLLIEGIPDMTKMPRGTRLFFPSGAVLESAGENVPCKHPGRVIHEKFSEVTETAFIRAANERRGIVGFTIRPGELRPGDEVVVEVPKHWAYTTKD